MNKIKLKDVIIFIISLVLMLGILGSVIFSMIPIQIEVDKEMEGIMFEANYASKAPTPVYIRINGTYEHYIFNLTKEDSFYGMVCVSDKPIPDEAVENTNMYTEIEDNIFSVYTDVIWGDTKDWCMGTVIQNTFYSKFVIGIGDNIVVCPADNADDALYIAMELQENTNLKRLFSDVSLSVQPNKFFEEGDEK